MKKITSKKLSKRLVQYGALSAAALGVADASGQVVYTDVDPDQVLNVGDEFIVDFTAMGTEFTISNPDGLAGGNAAIVFPSSGGAFVGFASGGFQYPSLLAAGDVIDAGAGYTSVGERGDLNYYGCAYSNSQWCNTVVDGYLGVTFQFNGNTHYGWVRMDTDVNGSNLITVKDFAFDATPDTAIAAGDGQLGVDDQVFEGFEYFVDNANRLNLSAPVAMEKIVMHNVLGQQVISQKLSNTNESLDLSSLKSGVYIATVAIEGTAKSFKIVKK
ncbi:MAG: T9SS type A sorting domain-containing protein [Flavobacteriales bacterium]|uniref:T9SS type A sorting domain-containing protein n=1 Tax=Candidatus Ulvibacter alkanivorans TaxID=2267620 RepID=UPI000DF23336|nr:T9SS type A sorting domain-containing protein [Candidatus Ulvibacter alkanivorans]MCH2489431.1 T9SS type A sorting domain-containing protein [Flavobacteriales bacterium]